jgi:hypothetical protein
MFTKRFNGISPRITNTTQQGNSSVAPLNEASQIPLDRKLIRRMFPTNASFQGTAVFSKRWPQTPFRVAMHAGDLLLRQSEPGGPNQVKGSVGIGRYRNTLGSGDGVRKGDGASGNQHYVYDSSVYTRYKKLHEKQKLYNDLSFGGSNNGAYVAIQAIRRF